MPSTTQVIMRLEYSPEEVIGVSVMTMVAGISFLSALGLLIVMIISALRSFQTRSNLMFVRTHVAAYFVSLLFSDIVQAAGSLLSIEWLMGKAVVMGVSCTAQGAIKNGGNVGTAIWSLVISIHTFCTLFLECRPRDFALYGTLIGVWTLIGAIVVIGPGALETDARGPYFGVTGLWCWITDPYQTERLMLEYLWMFCSVFFSFVFYALVYFKLRGNIIVSGTRIRFRRLSKLSQWNMLTGNQGLDSNPTAVAKQMLLYPLANFIQITPITVCRFATWAGYDVPVIATMISDAIFLSSGLVNTILFCATRKILPFQHLFRMRGSGKQVLDAESAIRTRELSQTMSAISNESFSATRMPEPLSPRSASKVNANIPPPPTPPLSPPMRVVVAGGFTRGATRPAPPSLRLQIPGSSNDNFRPHHTRETSVATIASVSMSSVDQSHRIRSTASSDSGHSMVPLNSGSRRMYNRSEELRPMIMTSRPAQPVPASSAAQPRPS